MRMWAFFARPNASPYADFTRRAQSLALECQERIPAAPDGPCHGRVGRPDFTAVFVAGPAG